MQNKNTNEKATAPQEATVAKTAKEAAIDPKTGDEIIGMDIESFDSDTDKVVKCDEVVQGIISDMMDEEYGYSEEEINSMSPYELIDEWLQWEGIIGYTDDILTLVRRLYHVDLIEWKRNNYLLPLVELFGPNGKFTKVGNKLHRSVAVFDYFDIYFDSIDIDREAKRLVEWIKEM